MIISEVHTKDKAFFATKIVKTFRNVIYCPCNIKPKISNVERFPVSIESRLRIMRSGNFYSIIPQSFFGLEEPRKQLGHARSEQLQLNLLCKLFTNRKT
jgi:hypothetical protein